jgi:hypothetical protein
MTNGTYIFQVLATDDNGGQDTAQVQITVAIAGTPPTVNAGPDAALIAPLDTVNVSGSATANGGNAITSVLWSQVSGPNTAIITGPSFLNTTFKGLVPGTYIFQLKATDNGGQQSTDAMTVIVGAPQPTTIEVHIRKGTNVLVITDN